MMDITINTQTIDDGTTTIDNAAQLELPQIAKPDSTVKSTWTLTTKHALGAIKLLGAGAVAAAMALFLFDGISVTNDIQRFFTILGFGAVLTTAGLVVNKFLSDRVASRLFIGLSLISVPVIAAVLGGLVYSLTPAAQLASYPTLATWTLASSASLWIAIPLGVLVVSAISSLGLMIMARAEVRWMTPALLASVALLVIPVRQSAIVALLACAAVAALAWIVRRYQANPISFKTLEGQLSLTILFSAPVIMIARSIALYEPDYLMLVCISGMLYGMTRHLFNASESNSKTQAAWMFAALVTGIAAVSSLTGFIDDSIVAFMPRHAADLNSIWFYNSTYHSVREVLPTFWVTAFLMMAFDLTDKRKDSGLSRGFSVLATCIASLVMIVFTITEQPFAFVIIVSTLILAAFMFNRYKRGQKFEAIVLLVTLFIILMNFSDWILRFMVDTGWWGLATGGIAAIIGGAVLESKNRRSTTVLE